MTKRLSDTYQEILANPTNSKLWQSQIWQGPSQSDVASWQAQGYGVYQGKIRTVLSRDGRIQLLHSDRLTAFDRLIDYIPLKGVILSAITKFWLEELGKTVPTHFIKELGPRALLVEAARPVKIEVIVRGYLAGSIARAYTAGERYFCGVQLPEGLKPFDRLPEPIITPTTKAAAFDHDENITAEQVVSRGICTKKEWDEISVMALKVFSAGSKIFLDRGWLLVDSKYEFGKGLDGSLKLIDEVHTPDSSRLWVAASYNERIKNSAPPEMLDKENIRRYLLEQGFSGYGDVPPVPRALLIELGKTYLNVAEKLIGKPLFCD